MSTPAQIVETVIFSGEKGPARHRQHDSWPAHSPGIGSDDSSVDLVGSLHTHDKLGLNHKVREFGTPGLQDRVNLLATFIKAENHGRTLLGPFQWRQGGADGVQGNEVPVAADDLEKTKQIFAYDGTEDSPEAWREIMLARTRDASAGFELQLTACTVDTGGVELLAHIVHTRGARALTLARCSFESAALEHLASALGSHAFSSLLTLGLDGNTALGDPAAADLAQALESNTTLEELSLWGTGIGDPGAQALAKALATNTSLKHLWLGECEGITDAGAQALLAALDANTVLDQLALIMTGASDSLQDDVEARLAARRELRAAAA